MDEYTGYSQSNSDQKQKLLIMALALGAIHIALYCFLPFIRLAVFVPLNGLTLMQNIHALYAFPLAMGVVLAGAGFFGNPLLMLGAGAASFLVAVLARMLTRVLIGSSNVTAVIATLSLLFPAQAQYLGQYLRTAITFLPVSLGVGGYLILFTDILYLAGTYLFASEGRNRTPPPPENPFGTGR
jgi:hypothetical protein